MQMATPSPNSIAAPDTSTTTTARVRPEILAPAGDWNCARAAVENGADAIYFGLEQFNARMRANNFTVSDLPDLMSFLHRRGVRGYVTFNTLVFADELECAAGYLKAIIAAGVDAAIVQDVGVCRLIRRLSPDFPIHASTQMTITSATGVDFARALGCNLAVLARECSIEEIERIQTTQRQTKQPSNVPDAPPVSEQLTTDSPTTDPLFTDSPPPLPLEVFVHGALCVAYSGQCLTSEALGGRSANRGECAQACRMPYELVSDGATVSLGDRRYLLSPQDLAGLEVLPELIRVGVASLKIEGRLKSPEYVAAITRVYREAVDRCMADASDASAFQQFAETSRYDLEMSFSRGLYSGWFRGIHNQELAHARFGKKRGVLLGRVTEVKGERVTVELEAPVKPGDGVVFDRGNPDVPEEGGRIYEVAPKQGSAAALAFGRGAIHFDRVCVGDRVWKTSDPEFDKRVRRTFEGDKVRFQRPVRAVVHGAVGLALSLELSDETGNSVLAQSELKLEPASNTPLTTDKLKAQLGRLGGTPFRLDALDNRLEGDVILPVSELNRLRRDAVQRLESLRAEPKRWRLHADASAETTQLVAVQEPIATDGGPTSEARLLVLVRSLEQFEAALDAGVETLYCDFENTKRYRDAVQRARATNSNSKVVVAPPRIFKSGEDWILEQVRSSEADGYLARNYDHLRHFAGERLIGDFSLNVANRLTAEYFMRAFNLERVTASYDLNVAQLRALLRSAPPEWFEVTLHQHMPMFHMEHCVFCAFMSTGRDYRDCGRPCEKHDVELRDRTGALHPLKADTGCRNTVFNARAQTGAEFYDVLFAAGLRHFRLEFLNETPAEVARTIHLYRELVAGRRSGGDLWRELKLNNQLGVTRGQLENAR